MKWWTRIQWRSREEICEETFCKEMYMHRHISFGISHMRVSVQRNDQIDDMLLTEVKTIKEAHVSEQSYILLWRSPPCLFSPMGIVSGKTELVENIIIEYCSEIYQYFNKIWEQPNILSYIISSWISSRIECKGTSKARYYVSINGIVNSM